MISRKCAGLFLLALTSILLVGYPRVETTPIRVALLGDILLGRGVASAHTITPLDNIFTPLFAPLQTVDLAIANLEGPVTSLPLIKSTYDLRSDGYSLLFLRDAGITYLTLANNHIYDSGPLGVIDTRQALMNNSLVPIGPDPTPSFVTVRGQTLAILALDDVSQKLNIPATEEIIRLAKSQSNWLFISIHWGAEYQAGASTRQQSLASRFASAGADVIFGHHPHVLQPTTWITQPDASNHTFVAYSLGNALFDQPFLPDANQSACLIISLDKIRGVAVKVLPFRINTSTGEMVEALPEDTRIILERLHLTEENLYK